MDYVRGIDLGKLESAVERTAIALLDEDTGATSCSVFCIKTPVGEGSSAGLHTHQVDQLFYILSGTMSVEIDEATHRIGPGTLVIFPAGLPHRNWNGGPEPTVHLAINSPLPASGTPFATPVGGAPRVAAFPNDIREA